MSRLVRSEREGGLLVVTIDRAEKRNALSRDTLEAIREAFCSAAPDPGILIALLTAAGNRAFAAGGDLRELQALKCGDEIDRFTRAARAALDSIRHFPVPVVALLNGDALGGGGELAMACDMRLAAHHVRIGFVQGRLAISTAWGGGIDLMRLLGPARGLELLATGRLVGAEEALRLGLVNAVVPAGEPDAAAFARRWCAPCLQQVPQVMRAFKAQALTERLGVPRAERERLEHEHFVASWLHADHWQAAESMIAGLGGPRASAE